MKGIEEKFHDECGVIGVYAPGKKDIARGVYFGLHSLQHLSLIHI